jgi:hypothetical protein
MKRIRLIDAAGKEFGNYDIEHDGHPHAAVHVNGRLFTLEPAAGLDPPAVRTYRECVPPNVSSFAEVKDELDLSQQQRKDPPPQRQQQPVPARVQTTEHNAGEKTHSDPELTSEVDGNEESEAALEKAIEESKGASAAELAEIDTDLRIALAKASNAGDLLPLWAAAFDTRTAQLRDPSFVRGSVLAQLSEAKSKQDLRDIASRASIAIPATVPDRMVDLAAFIRGAVG